VPHSPAHLQRKRHVGARCAAAGRAPRGAQPLRVPLALPHRGWEHPNSPGDGPAAFPPGLWLWGRGTPRQLSPAPPGQPPSPRRTKGKGNKTKPTAQMERGRSLQRPPRALQLRLRARDARALADLLPLLLLPPPLLLLPQRLLEGVGTGEKLRGDSGGRSARGELDAQSPHTHTHRSHRTSPAVPGVEAVPRLEVGRGTRQRGVLTLPWEQGTRHPNPAAAQPGNGTHAFQPGVLHPGGFWPFPTKAPVPFSRNGVGKPTGPSYLRVVRFKGIAVIGRFLADPQLLSHLQSKAETSSGSGASHTTLPCDRGLLPATSPLCAPPPSLSPRTLLRCGVRSPCPLPALLLPQKPHPPAPAAERGCGGGGRGAVPAPGPGSGVPARRRPSGCRSRCPSG